MVVVLVFITLEELRAVEVPLADMISEDNGFTIWLLCVESEVDCRIVFDPVGESKMELSVFAAVLLFTVEVPSERDGDAEVGKLELFDGFMDVAFSTETVKTFVWVNRVKSPSVDTSPPSEAGAETGDPLKA